MLRRVFDAKTAKRPLRVAVMFSGSASSMRALLQSRHHGKLFQIICALTNKPQSTGTELAKEHSIPLIIADYKEFKDEKKGLDPWEIRAQYDGQNAQSLKKFEPDIIALSGYMLIVTDALLNAFPILNVHPADLSIRYSGGESSGRRVFIGDDAVADAVLLGQTHLKSTIHFLSRNVDAGPIFVQSRPIVVDQSAVRRMRKKKGETAVAQWARETVQEIMKVKCDGPAYIEALRIIASSEVFYDSGPQEETHKVVADKMQLPYEGIQIKKDPITIPPPR